MAPPPNRVKTHIALPPLSPSPSSSSSSFLLRAVLAPPPSSLLKLVAGGHRGPSREEKAVCIVHDRCQVVACSCQRENGVPTFSRDGDECRRQSRGLAAFAFVAFLFPALAFPLGDSEGRMRWLIPDLPIHALSGLRFRPRLRVLSLWRPVSWGGGKWFCSRVPLLLHVRGGSRRYCLTSLQVSLRGLSWRC